MLSFDDIEIKVAALPRASLIAIDGMPCSGKSTLAERLHKELNYDIIAFDDFFLSTKYWPADLKPNYPFPFNRWMSF